MKIKQFTARLLIAAVCVIAFKLSATAQHVDQPRANQPAANQDPKEKIPVTAVPALTLENLEQMALKNNPTLAQAEAAIQAAEGRRRQAGLWPNPIVGYEGEGLAFNSLVYPYRNA